MTFTLRLRQVRKRYGQRQVLAIDELHLRPGEIIHLSGRNGAGKSTLLKIIAGLERPQQTEVSLDGRSGSWQRMAAALRRRVVYLHQQPFMFDASVTDNLGYGLRAAGIPRATLRDRVQEALTKADLISMAKRNARTLSGGEQQRLALARAWVVQPSVLLLDEPTANMDVEFRDQTWQLLQTMRSADMSLVITNHERNGPGIDDCRRLRLAEGQLHEQPSVTLEDNVIRWPSESPPWREAQS